MVLLRQSALVTDCQLFFSLALQKLDTSPNALRSPTATGIERTIAFSNFSMRCRRLDFSPRAPAAASDPDPWLDLEHSSKSLRTRTLQHLLKSYLRHDTLWSPNSQKKRGFDEQFENVNNTSTPEHLYTQTPETGTSPCCLWPPTFSQKTIFFLFSLDRSSFPIGSPSAQPPPWFLTFWNVKGEGGGGEGPQNV